MAGLVPFNKKNKEISTNTGFEDFYNVLDDYFFNDWPFKEPSHMILSKLMSKIMAMNT